jgi:hypothetical protein
MDRSTICQVVIATHSPLLMAYPGAQLLRLSKYGLGPVTLQETAHNRLLREFCIDQVVFIDSDGRLSIRHLSSNVEDGRLRKIVFSGFQGGE